MTGKNGEIHAERLRAKWSQYEMMLRKQLQATSRDNDNGKGLTRSGGGVKANRLAGMMPSCTVVEAERTKKISRANKPTCQRWAT